MPWSGPMVLGVPIIDRQWFLVFGEGDSELLGVRGVLCNDRPVIARQAALDLASKLS